MSGASKAERVRDLRARLDRECPGWRDYFRAQAEAAGRKFREVVIKVWGKDGELLDDITVFADAENLETIPGEEGNTP